MPIADRTNCQHTSSSTQHVVDKLGSEETTSPSKLQVILIGSSPVDTTQTS